MGWVPILCICVSISTMLNFHAHGHAHGNANAMCKQSLKSLLSVWPQNFRLFAQVSCCIHTAFYAHGHAHGHANAMCKQSLKSLLFVWPQNFRLFAQVSCCIHTALEWDQNQDRFRSNTQNPMGISVVISPCGVWKRLHTILHNPFI